MVARETSIRLAFEEMGVGAHDLAVARLARFAEILEQEAIPLGFLGPHEAGRILSRHLLEGVALATILPPDGPLIDVGSGAGLPGIAIACVRGGPVSLLDSLDKRVAFLRRTADALELEVTVVSARAEEAARSAMRDSFAVATARALARPAVTLELTLPFVRMGGIAATLVSPEGGRAAPRNGEPEAETDAFGDRGGSGEDVITDADAVDSPAGASSSSGDAGLHRFIGALEPVADQLGGGDVRLVPLEVPGLDGPRWVMIVNKLRSTPDRFPRRTGIPSRRPLA